MPATPDTEIAIYATSILTAQGVTLTASQRNTLVAKADYLRELTKTNQKFTVSVPVLDVYTGAKIGKLDYSL